MTKIKFNQYVSHIHGRGELNHPGKLKSTVHGSRFMREFDGVFGLQPLPEVPMGTQDWTNPNANHNASCGAIPQGTLFILPELSCSNQRQARTNAACIKLSGSDHSSGLASPSSREDASIPPPNTSLPNPGIPSHMSTKHSEKQPPHKFQAAQISPRTDKSKLSTLIDNPHLKEHADSYCHRGFLIFPETVYDGDMQNRGFLFVARTHDTFFSHHHNPYSCRHETNFQR